MNIPISSYLDGATDKTLQTGNVIRMLDGSFHYVQYVNSSGAYVVPLSTVNREIKGQVVAFTAGGRTISSRSTVEVVNPLVMGGNCAEYRRYVKMVEASGKQGIGMGEGVTFDSFDSTELASTGDTANLDETDSVPTTKGMEMAKKNAKAAKAGKAKGGAKREKTPKTVRNCVCGCGAETTGRFAPGHDARFHGWIKKLADGRIQKNGKDKDGTQVVPASVLNKLGLVAKGDGFKATTPEYYID